MFHHPLFIILLTLITCAFFSGLEIAFLTANKLKIELDRKQGVLSAKIFSKFLKQPSHFISTTLLGNCISIVIYGIYSEEYLEPFIEQLTHSGPIIFITKMTISTVFILLTAEYIPKSLFSINPNFTLHIFAIPFIIIYYLLYPLVFITMNISEFIINRFAGNTHTAQQLSFGKVDLENYLNTVNNTADANNNNVDHEVKIFQNALVFAQLKARDCMIPRTEIAAIEINAPIETLQNKFADTGFSKVIVYRDTIDNIIGYVHSLELFSKPTQLKALILPVVVVPESKAAQEILTLMLQQRRSVAVVVDEFGGTAGLITTEDIIEKIVGDVEDEHDDDMPIERMVNENEYVFSSRLDIDYINEKYQLRLPDNIKYETLAGLIIHHSQNIPLKNDVIHVGKFVFTILSVSQKRIELVKMNIVK